MRERIDLAARWGDRRESLDDCANHAAQCLRQLAMCDEVFGQWFQLAKSRKQALECPFEPKVESCHNLLAKGRNRYDSTRDVIEDLGFSMELWSGREDDSATSVRFQGGAYPAVRSMPNPNTCLIEFPYAGPAADRVFQVHKLQQVMTAVAESWDPDWARVSSYQMRKSMYPDLYQGVEVGWMTYFSRRYGSLPTLPDACQVIEVGKLGNLIIITTIDRFTASDPSHVEAARRLSGILETNGLLVPTPTRRDSKDV